MNLDRLNCASISQLIDNLLQLNNGLEGSFVFQCHPADLGLMGPIVALGSVSQPPIFLQQFLVDGLVLMCLILPYCQFPAIVCVKC